MKNETITLNTENLNNKNETDGNSDEKSRSTRNPFSTQVIKSFTLQTKEEAEQKIEDSHEAFKTWSKRPLKERVDILSKFSKELDKNKDELAELMTTEMGKRLSESHKEIELCMSISDYYCENAESILADTEKDFEEGRAFVTYQPTGVLLSIQPWNFPLYQVVRNMIPNLVAGNTMVLKHASSVWGCAEMIAKFCENIDLPEDVFNVLYVGGETASELVSHKRIRGVYFTGSEGTGRKVAEKAGKELKKTVMELGGSDPYIVLADADIDLAVETCVKGRIINNGQVCTGAKRFIVVDDVYEEFRDKFVAKMKEVQLGDPMDKATQMGPMARKDLRDDLADQVEKSIEKGAKCLVGGNIPKRDGYFYEATVLENVNPGMPAYDEELFGPVASLIKAKDTEDAIRISNDTDFGLGGGIFTKDVSKGEEIAKMRMDTGMININGFVNSRANLPFGGVKNSGYGRELGSYGFTEFLNIKVVKVIDQK